MAVPKYDELFNPLLDSLRALGGSASIQEQEDEVASRLKLSEKDLAEIHRGNRTKFGYRLAWARNYLKRFGLIDNSSRGVWALTAEGYRARKIDKAEIKRFVVALDRKEQKERQPEEKTPEAEALGWEEQLLECVRRMAPDAFERLSQRLLRESGFIQVEVTGRSGDGGIDGKGVVRIGGLLSFHMIFQCKRFKGSVGSSVIRDFRGAMIGRADKGLMITTGTYTAEARREAQRDGAPTIDLIDGEALVQKLKELELGVNVRQRTVEDVIVVPEFFQSI
ncbi:MAG: restriction endonuclease [Thiobacillus sp. 65-69]|nr:restriction endonuclease [Thiobacillus sp.]ODU88756.1 MAG: restriction endonuclease [Thiobacillus sp. SCN 65-179]OJW39083.1 MAG: restriction endonuclease [Thiobacillus sp. 65-69]